MTLKVGDGIMCNAFPERAYARIVGETKTQWRCRPFKWSPTGGVLGTTVFNISKRTGVVITDNPAEKYIWGEIGLQCHAEGCRNKARWHVWFVGWPLYDSVCNEHMAERAAAGGVDGWPISQISLVAESFLPPDDAYWQFKKALYAGWKDPRPSCTSYPAA